MRRSDTEDGAINAEEEIRACSVQLNGARCLLSI